MENEMEELLLRFCEGRVTEEERRRVEAWRDDSEENRQMLRNVLALCVACDAERLAGTTEVDEALETVRGRMSDRHRISRTAWWHRAQRAAAILFVPLLAASLYLYLHEAGRKPSQLVEVRTNPGMTTTLTLPDGTLVSLNSESVLSYPSRFDSETRNVTLSGEAYFEVAKNPRKKFIVSTASHSQIEVLGTHFNVEAYKTDSHVSATLLEGSIRFVYRQDSVSKGVRMTPGQKLVYDPEDGNIRIYATSGETETAWKDGKIIFRNIPLEEGLRMLEKRYNVEFVIRGDRLKTYSFTGTFTNQRLDRILEYFRLSSHIRWQYLDSSNMTDYKSKIEIY